jgi:GNAT superfamily N-acetyltransferase
MKIIEITFDDFTITTDKSKMDIVAIHDFLSKYSGWSDNIPFDRVKTSIDNSLNFGLFHNDKQIGFARIISDFSTIAYLGDIYVLDNYRGQGLSKKLMDAVIEHPNLQGLRRWILAHPDQCVNMHMLPRDHPSGRHSEIDWSKPDPAKFPNWNKIRGNEVILQPGDYLYVPTYWIHYIVSLNVNFQCNTRSGKHDSYDKLIRKCGF